MSSPPRPECRICEAPISQYPFDFCGPCRSLLNNSPRVVKELIETLANKLSALRPRVGEVEDRVSELDRTKAEKPGCTCRECVR